MECGSAGLVLPNLRVFGHDMTARLTSSINTMASQAGQVFVAWVLFIAMATFLTLLASRPLAGL